jgi:hypothetical protein
MTHICFFDITYNASTNNGIVSVTIPIAGKQEFFGLK